MDNNKDIINNEKGFSEELDIGPVNQHNYFNYFGGSDSHTKHDNPYNGVPGNSGDTKGPPRNPMVQNPGKPGEFDDLDMQKELFMPKVDSKIMSFEDAAALPYDYKGQGNSTEDLGGYNGIAPSNNRTDQKHPFFYVHFSPGEAKSPVTSVEDVPSGFTGTDGGLFKKNSGNTSVTPSVKNKVTNDLKNNVKGNGLSGGASGFDATRGTSPARSSRAEENSPFIKYSATQTSNTVDLTTPSARRNDQSPWSNEGKNLKSYTKEELDSIRNNGPFILFTQMPSSFMDRLYATDTKNMAGGIEFMTTDFLNIPSEKQKDKDKDKFEQIG